MKSLIGLLVISVNFFACDFGSLNQEKTSENAMTQISPSPGTVECEKTDYKHKSETELAIMTPAQLVDEEIKEQNYHMPAGASDSQPSILLNYIRRSGIKVLPVLTEIAKQFDSNDKSRCARVQFFVAFHIAQDIDNVVIRIRTTGEGQSTIEALQAALERKKNAGLEDETDKRFYASNVEDLEILKGVDFTTSDSIIRDSLRVKHNVHLSDEELLAFSNFLTALDPKYPSWSEIGEYSAPMVVKDSKKYYEAYLKFKAKN